jgi:hypothetical protein
MLPRRFIIMKKLTQEEFNDRVQAIHRAKKIFSALTKGNITNAFIAYQEILAEQERQINISAKQAIGMTSSPFNNLERPKCPECGEVMNLRPVQPNDEGINSQLVCANPKCDTVLDSELTLQQWMEKLGGIKRLP